MKKLWILVFIFGWLGVSVAQAQKTEPPYSLDRLSAYSIFLENYRSENYEMALDYGRWILFAKPEKIEGYSQFDLQRNLDRLITVYSEMANQKEDPTIRSAYLDSALMVYDIAFKTFKGKDGFDEFDWKMQKGRFYQENSDHLDDAMSKARKIYMDLYEKDPKRFTKRGEGYYMQVVLQELISAEKKDRALAMIQKTEKYASEKLKSYYDEVRGQLFESSEQRIKFLKSQIEEKPKSAELLDKLLQIYEEEEKYSEAKDIAERLYNLESSYENAKRLAEIAMNNANYKKAIKYLKEAADKTDDKSKLKRIAIDVADSYLNDGKLKSAREWARKANSYDEEWGEPYLMISSIYARAVSGCTSNREMDRNDKVVYWLVLDYLDKAKNVDERTTNVVEQRYESYEPVTPTQEEKFFKNWETGDEIEVDSNLHDCYDWINETTTVR